MNFPCWLLVVGGGVGGDFATAGLVKPQMSCWPRCWNGCGMHFRSHDAEQRFLAYLHSDQFYKVLRVPFSLFAAVFLVEFVATVAVAHSPR